MGVDLWKLPQWQMALAGAEVAVLTPQVITHCPRGAVPWEGPNQCECLGSCAICNGALLGCALSSFQQFDGPQVLLNMLTHGYIKMENIALMVLDECHNARKNHVYAQIMKDFYWPVARAGGRDSLPKACLLVPLARPALPRCCGCRKRGHDQHNNHQRIPADIWDDCIASG